MSSILIVLLHTFILCRSQIINYQCNFDTDLLGDCQFTSTTGGPAMIADPGSTSATNPKQPLSDVKATYSPTTPDNEHCELPYIYPPPGGGWAMHFCRRFTATNFTCPTKSGSGRCNPGKFGLIKLPNVAGSTDHTYVATVQKSSNREQCLDFYYYIQDITENAKIEISWESDEEIDSIIDVTAVPSENKWQHKQVSFMGPSSLSSYELNVRVMRDKPQLNFAFAFDEMYIYDGLCGNVFVIDDELFYFILFCLFCPAGATTTIPSGSTPVIEPTTTKVTDPATTTGSTTTGSTTVGSTITGSTATGSTITGSTITGSTATSSPTPGTTITGSTITGSTTTGSTITGSTITGSTTPGTTITGSTITGSTTTGSTITGSTITGSTATSSPTPGTTITGSTITGSTATSSPTPGTTTTGSTTTPNMPTNTDPNLALILPLAVGIPVSLGIIGSIAYYFKVFKPKHKINVNTNTADDIPMISPNNTTDNSTTVDALVV
ncbi:unnamed protein product [Adineta steineri]|uniref:MAM domain-containing protein n=1 Tax=Adineta steineri TaxID=433720 RepID=A0A819B1P3_9BILA|nr:unnamed protein product [Adineta steineri]CAF3789244.1 unnamed protein product [Adineta steineri]